MTETDRSAVTNLFNSIGKMDFMRIDGRLNENGFTLIELTPDAYLGRKSAFNDAALASGISYDGLLEKIIITGLGNNKPSTRALRKSPSQSSHN